MQWLSSFLLGVQVLSSLSIIVLVLLQQGKGADMGSSFGGGSAGSLFGSAGAANFLSRTTRWAAIVFFAATIGLAYNAHNTGNSILDGGLMQDYQPTSSQPAPGTTPNGAVPSLPGSGSAVPQAPAPAAGGEVPSSVPQAAPNDTPAASAPEATPNTDAAPATSEPARPEGNAAPGGANSNSQTGN